MHDPIPIKVAMVRQKVNGEQLAARAGVSRPTVSRIVNGKRVMPEGTYAAFELLSAKTYPTGVVALHYGRQGSRGGER